jgi:hypothetical protein
MPALPPSPWTPKGPKIGETLSRHDEDHDEICIVYRTASAYPGMQQTIINMEFKIVANGLVKTESGTETEVDYTYRSITAT